VRVLGDEVAELVPHRVVRLATLRNKVGIVDKLGQQDGGLVQAVNGGEVLDVVLGVVREQLEVAPEDANGRLLDALVAMEGCRHRFTTKLDK